MGFGGFRGFMGFMGFDGFQFGFGVRGSVCKRTCSLQGLAGLMSFI